MSKTYKLSGDHEFTSEDTAPEVLEKAREQAVELMKDGDVMLRSCWVCNGAHAHFIEEAGVVLNCFGCGHLYLGGIDLMEGDVE